MKIELSGCGFQIFFRYLRDKISSMPVHASPFFTNYKQQFHHDTGLNPDEHLEMYCAWLAAELSRQNHGLLRDFEGRLKSLEGMVNEILINQNKK